MATLTTQRPVLASTRAELDSLLAIRRPGSQIGLVPTMGALHDGHASLLRLARDRVGTGPLVASIFVNPLQFGPGEDFERYPRTLDADLAVCAREDVDVVFAPAVDELYPDGEPQVVIDPGRLGEILEGKVRPAHFRGVLSVVAKLFGLVRPDVAVFGQKDYQQLVLIRRMSGDLCQRVEVIGAETLREDDGLARSSRNLYLDETRRQQATVLFRALQAAQGRASYGVAAARWAAMSVLQSEPELELDYLALCGVDLDELDDDADGVEGRILVAGRLGSTRLIDNLPVTFGRCVDPLGEGLRSRARPPVSRR